MWLIKKWDFQTIDFETTFLYTLLEQKIYINKTEGMSEIPKEHYMYENILTLIIYLYDIIKEAH